MVGATTVKTLVKKSLTFAGVAARMQYSLSMHRRVVPGSFPQQSPSTSSYADFSVNFRQREAVPAILPVQTVFLPICVPYGVSTLYRDRVERGVWKITACLESRLMPTIHSHVQ